jgi:hypothetical protein
MFTLPDSAKNVRIRVTIATGLAWEPTRTILEQTLPEIGKGKCFEVGGTTLNATVSECQL